jgi:hypothetical protein
MAAPGLTGNPTRADPRLCAHRRRASRRGRAPADRMALRGCPPRSVAPVTTSRSPERSRCRLADGATRPRGQSHRDARAVGVGHVNEPHGDICRCGAYEHRLAGQRRRPAGREDLQTPARPGAEPGTSAELRSTQAEIRGDRLDGPGGRGGNNAHGERDAAELPPLADLNAVDDREAQLVLGLVCRRWIARASRRSPHRLWTGLLGFRQLDAAGSRPDDALKRDGQSPMVKKNVGQCAGGESSGQIGGGWVDGRQLANGPSTLRTTQEICSASPSTSIVTACPALSRLTVR